MNYYIKTSIYLNITQKQPYILDIIVNK